MPLPRTLPAESRLRRAYRAQLLRLPADTRGLMLLAAADEETDPDTLGRAATVAALDLAALEPAESAGLLRVEDNRIQFEPPLMRGIVYHESTLARRRSVHAALAAALDPQAEPLRHHLHRALAVTGPDERLAGDLATAAAEGGRGTASRAFERAAELSADPAAAAARLISSARCAWRAGEPHRAQVLLRRVRTMTVPARLHAESEVLHGEIELQVGATTLARYTLLAAAERAAPHDRDLAIAALMRAGEALCISGEYLRYPALARRVSALRRPDEPPGVAFMGAHFATLSATFRGEHRQAAESLRQVLALAPRLDAGALVHASLAALLCGSGTEALGLAVRGAAIARVNGDPATGARAMDLVALAEYAIGRYDNPASALEALDLARAAGQENLVSAQFATLAMLAAQIGDRPACLRRVRAAKAHLTPHNTRRVRAVANWALAVLDLADANYDNALARLTSAATHRGGHLLVQVAATPYLVEAAVRCDARPTAADALEVYDAWTAETAEPHWLALAARCHALLAGRSAEADEHFREALRQHALCASELDRAHTELLYGQALRRARRPAAARVHLRGAWETFERFDARLWADQAASELRAAGQHAEPRCPPATGALTPQQTEIARLVAAGATNREIAAHLVLSIRTIDHHLRNIFTKLGVRSRVELTRLMF